MKKKQHCWQINSAANRSIRHVRWRIAFSLSVNAKGGHRRRLLTTHSSPHGHIFRKHGQVQNCGKHSKNSILGSHDLEAYHGLLDNVSSIIKSKCRLGKAVKDQDPSVIQSIQSHNDRCVKIEIAKPNRFQPCQCENVYLFPVTGRDPGSLVFDGWKHLKKLLRTYAI